MRSDFDPTSLEAKWQKRWEDAQVYDIDLKKARKPYYSLVMFPYPSGAKLHVGHWFQYSIPDSYVRFLKMRGTDVFHPIGFDAFGLPAENYAIKTGIHPAVSTAENVKTMVEQFKRMGVMYDWKYLIDTSTPQYYRWTQWLFLQMFKNGLAYKKEGNVNFCPSCQTVLANEQAQDGKCERCGSDVQQKALPQWYWKITKYSDALIDGLDALDWPEKTKIMQRNWIGRKTGINITYSIDGADEQIVCFTTRPDTNFGATFIVLAPEHPFVQKISRGEISPAVDIQKSVQEYVERTSKKTELERQEEGRKKTGAFTGFYAINTLNNSKMPIWVSDFVLAGFGTGAVVGVPGHDLRDFEFAQSFGIPVLRVVVASDGDTSPITRPEQVQEDEGTMVNSDFLNGLPIMEAKEKIMDFIVEHGWGERVTTYRLRDWLVSRQRYWGAPIPIVYDPEGNPHPVPEKYLPWVLPTDVAFKPTGKSPLAYSKEFVERTEKIFGKGWTPECDTMDTFVCSSFYQLMFLTEHQRESLDITPDSVPFLDPLAEKKWMPVTQYIGGPEHACMHLIYARFVTMALKDFGFIKNEEPFKKLVHQGLITHKGAKMSKSRGNVVSPDEFVARYGSDVFRMFLMFMGPFTDGGDWSDTGIKGIDRFVRRLHTFFSNNLNKKKVDQPKVVSLLHVTIKKVTEDIEALHFNTAIASLMEFLNFIEEVGGISSDTAKILALLLTPLAPHLAEELWEMLGNKDFAIEQKWPTFNPALTKASTVTIAIQVNGKLRGDIEVSAKASKEDVLAEARKHPNVAKFLEGQTMKKEIYIPGKLVSLVV